MKTPIKLLCSVVIAALACTTSIEDDVELRMIELESDGFDSGDESECSDAAQVVPGESTKQYTVVSTSLIELHDGVVATIDPETGIMTLQDNGLSGFQCRCSTGCSELSACEPGGGPTQQVCSGTCSGTSDDGKACSFCTWHLVEVPSPGGSPGAGLDPTGDPFPKPPGMDPTAGELDPASELPPLELPPMDPSAGELDPTW